MTQSTARQSTRNPQSSAAKARAAKRSRDARLALSEPAQVIAKRARARYESADKVSRLPSKKPRIVKAPKKQERSLVWVMRLFAVGIVISLFAVVGIQTMIAKHQIAINEIRDQQSQEITKFEKNRHEVAKLKSPERITRRAQNLGLVQPEKFISVTIPMAADPRGGYEDDPLWREVKAIINATS